VSGVKGTNFNYDRICRDFGWYLVCGALPCGRMDGLSKGAYRFPSVLVRSAVHRINVEPKARSRTSSVRV
jgi:hypothetical protein